MHVRQSSSARAGGVPDPPFCRGGGQKGSEGAVKRSPRLGLLSGRPRHLDPPSKRPGNCPSRKQSRTSLLLGEEPKKRGGGKKNKINKATRKSLSLCLETGRCMHTHAHDDLSADAFPAPPSLPFSFGHPRDKPKSRSVGSPWAPASSSGVPGVLTSVRLPGECDFRFIANKNASKS